MVAQLCEYTKNTELVNCTVWELYLNTAVEKYTLKRNWKGLPWWRSG